MLLCSVNADSLIYLELRSQGVRIGKSMGVRQSPYLGRFGNLYYGGVDLAFPCLNAVPINDCQMDYIDPSLLKGLTQNCYKPENVTRKVSCIPPEKP